MSKNPTTPVRPRGRPRKDTSTEYNIVPLTLDQKPKDVGYSEEALGNLWTAELTKFIVEFQNKYGCSVYTQLIGLDGILTVAKSLNLGMVQAPEVGWVVKKN